MVVFQECLQCFPFVILNLCSVGACMLPACHLRQAYSFSSTSRLEEGGDGGGLLCKLCGDNSLSTYERQKDLNFHMVQRHFPCKKSRDGTEYKCLRCEKRFPMDKKKIYIKHFMHQHLKKAIEEEMKKRKPEGELYQTVVVSNQIHVKGGQLCCKYHLSLWRANQ